MGDCGHVLAGWVPVADRRRAALAGTNTILQYRCISIRKTDKVNNKGLNLD